MQVRNNTVVTLTPLSQKHKRAIMHNSIETRQTEIQQNLRYTIISSVSKKQFNTAIITRAQPVHYTATTVLPKSSVVQANAISFK